MTRSTSCTARTPRTPWRGRSPVESGLLTGYLAATLEQRLREETSGPVGQVVMAPTDAPPPGEESTMKSLAQGLNMLCGKVVARLVQRDPLGSMGEGRKPNRTWASATRIRAEPPASLVELRGQSYAQTLAFCGIPPEVVMGLGQGTAVCGAQRRWMSTGLDALGRVAAAELSAKLDAPITLNFDALAKTDIAARERSFKPLTEAGIEPEEAKRLTGLD